jgi:hypothetical protein
MVEFRRFLKAEMPRFTGLVLGAHRMKRARRTLGSTAVAGLATSVILGALGVTPASAQSDAQEHNAYDDSGYTYCDATLLAAAWHVSVWDAKAAIGGKLLNHWTASEIDQEIAPGRHLRQCSFDDEGYSYEDAQALGRLWGMDPLDSKIKIGRMLTAGRRYDVTRVLAQARQR